VSLVVAMLVGARPPEHAVPSEAALVAAAPAPLVRDTPELVDVVVRVSPPSAQIAIDGTQMPTNPFHARYAKDAQVHRVLASAEGYDAKLEEVFFANDVSIDVSLDRRAPPAPHFFVPPAAHPGRHPATTASATTAAGDASVAPPSPSAHTDVGPAGGHVPLRPIVTSNPYGSP
jgi:hypothetical protein